MLSQIPPSDVVTSEHWSSLKKSLSLALGDENDGISVSMPLMILILPKMCMLGWSRAMSVSDLH
jgi:hypothetical protein